MSMNYGMEMSQYTIQAGDSLWDLADGYHTTVESIMEANPDMDPNNLYAGQVISIPSGQLAAGTEQFRFGPGFRGPVGRRPFGPGFRRPFRPFGPPFRRFRPFFPSPVVVPYPIPSPYYCDPYDPYCQYYPY